MATANKNLSDYDVNSIPNAKKMRFAIVVAEWNINITSNLLKGAYDTLIKHGAQKKNINVKYVPGSFELAVAAQTILEKTEVDAVICLGSVIQGDTKHFDFVCQATALGIKDVSLMYNTPVIFGVLTDNTLQQAIDRSGGKHGNKGDEAAITAIKMVHFQKEI
ncbi:MAG: 6,7-dimethyl-8-ribityllumazine synthase [Flavobacteriales bacterium]|nr:6,7-dimethyl-8-ribityllumazine synthase [Flavobacteriales bacterium]